MHISEGVLSPAVLAGGAALAVAGTAIGLKKLDYEAIPRVAILSAAFFVATLIHVPVGPVGTTSCMTVAALTPTFPKAESFREGVKTWFLQRREKPVSHLKHSFTIS